MTKLVLITIRNGPRAGHWLGFRFDDGREVLLTFKGRLGHCIAL